MRYKVVTVAKPTSCCTDRVASLDSDIEEVCNDMASRGFVLVSAFDTQQPTCGLCLTHNCMFAPQTTCWKKATCLVFASP